MYVLVVIWGRRPPHKTTRRGAPERHSIEACWVLSSGAGEA